MASITANGAKGHHKFTLTVTETATSTASNTSTVSFNFKISPIQTSWDWNSWGSYISYSININGTPYTGTIPAYDGSSTVTLKSGTQTVIHNDDGKKEISYSFSVTDKANQRYTCGNASASGTLALTTIPRQATLLSATDFSDVENPTITYSNPAGAAATSLAVGIFNLNEDITYVSYRTDLTKTGTSYTITLTDAEREALIMASANSNYIDVKFKLKTVIGGVEYYSEPLTRKFSVNDADPILTASVIDANDKTYALTNDRNKLIRYYSDAYASFTAEAQKGATIDESLYIIRNGDNTGYSNEHTFYGVEDNEFTFSAEDSRGNIGTTTVTPVMVDYTQLTCYIDDNRPDALGNMSVACSGSWFNGDFGAAVNTLTVQYRYTTAGVPFTDNWVDMDVDLYSDWYYASAQFVIPDFSQQQSYSFETRAIDKLSTVSSTASSVKTVPIYHWGENDFVVEVPVDVKGDLNVGGDLRLKGSDNFGNTLRFGDSDYCYIAEPVDDGMVIHARNSIELDAPEVIMYGSTLNDFVVEQGESGSWKYRKWQSGIAECWITISMSSAVNTAWGGMYTTGIASPRLDYPFSFISRPREIVTSHCSSPYGLITYSYVNNTSTKTGTYDVIRPTAELATLTIYFDIYAIGKWK